MSETIHNPDQYMAALRTIVAQGRKRIGLLVGAGFPAGIAGASGAKPLVPGVADLTNRVLNTLNAEYGKTLDSLAKGLPNADIEALLSKIRSFSKLLGAEMIHGLNGEQFGKLSEAICAEIGKVVTVSLPTKHCAYSDVVSWITGTTREFPIEIFTTNYDLLFEEALEAVGAPYFDGFTGSREPFFDPVSVSKNDLPARWTRLWKLHGSLGWAAGAGDCVVRTGNTSSTHLVFPEHLKYDQTQKAPYAALLDRLRSFLSTPDTLLVSIGCSFSDAHITARIGEALAANPSASVFAFQFGRLAMERCASSLANRCPNFSVYARDRAVINGVAGSWNAPAELPNRDWAAIRSTYWGRTSAAATAEEFLLGDVAYFGGFLAASRSHHLTSSAIATVAPALSGAVASVGAAT